ncbi:MAG: soluble lytic murein transglycosylase [Reinekea sp.]|jgi:soluble lytic murein transglycosylase
MSPIRTLFFSLVCLMSINNACAGFLEIKDQIETNSINFSTLKTYKKDPLYPHLLGLWYEQHIEKTSVKDIEQFRSHDENKAAYWLLKNTWQREVIRRENWSLIAKEFANEKSPELQCHLFVALEKLDRPIPENLVAALWQSGHSRPDHCDPFLLAWLDQQPNQGQLIWQRQLLAFYSRNGNLLRYLNRFYVNEPDKKKGEFLAAVYQNPKEVINQGYDPSNSDMRELALASVNKMAYIDPRSASNLWLKLVKVTPDFEPKEIRTASRYLGLAMAKQGLPEANYWLTIADSSRSDSEVQHWRLQIALSKDQIDEVIYLYSELSDSLKKTEQWQYWYGYALLKQTSAQDELNPLYSLSKKRSYYGYMAAGLLGLPTQLSNNTPYPIGDPDKVRNNTSANRAKLLFQLDEIDRAQVEWNLWLRNLDAQTQHDAAELALEWGWYSKASQAAGWSRRYDLIHLRYPKAYASIIDYHAELLAIPDFWIYGVIRQESRYMQQAKSPVGARGLMQLMPKTAAATAQKYNVDYATTNDLNDPVTNIALGSHYLSELLIRFEHPVYATAAYNAGPSRVVAWQKRYPTNIPVWIESIPFDETRNYVKAVLVYSQVYALTADNGWQLNQWTQQNTGVAQLN